MRAGLVLALAALVATLVVPAGPLVVRADDAPPAPPDLEIVAVHLNGTMWRGNYTTDTPITYEVGVRNLGTTVAHDAQVVVMADPHYYLDRIALPDLAPGDVYWTSSDPDAAANPAVVDPWPTGERSLIVQAGYNTCPPYDCWETQNDSAPENSYQTVFFRIVPSAGLSWSLYSAGPQSSHPIHEALAPFFIDYGGPDPDDQFSVSGIACKWTWEAVNVTVTVEVVDGTTGTIELAQGSMRMELPRGWSGCWYADLAFDAHVVGPYVARMMATPDDMPPGAQNDPADDSVSGTATGYVGYPQPPGLP